MIKLFDYFNGHSRKLYESFKASKLEEDLTIVLNDNGFTGRCYITVSIFADNHNTENMKPRFLIRLLYQLLGN